MSISFYVRESGKQVPYETDAQTDARINIEVRMMTALAFVRPADVALYFEELQEYVHSSLEPMLDYLEDNYVGRRVRRGRKQPRFPREWWNVYERSLQSRPRTNNHAEAGHRCLQCDFGYSHPTLGKFIDKLQTCQKTRDIDYDQLEGGIEPRPKELKYQKCDECLYKLLIEYDEREPIEYLRAIVHNLSSQ